MKRLVIFLSSLLLLGLNGCSPIYYSPTAQHVPLLTEKGYVNLSLYGGYGTDSEPEDESVNLFGLNGAAAITNNLALKLSTGFAFGDENGYGQGNGQNYEFGGGFFAPLGEEFVIEGYGYYGTGRVKYEYERNSSSGTVETVTSNFSSVGFQPNFGYRTKYFSAAISGKFHSVQYNNVKGDLVFSSVDQIAYIQNQDSHFHIEPAVTIAAGYKQFMGQLQIVKGFNTTNDSFRQSTLFPSIAFAYKFGSAEESPEPVF